MISPPPRHESLPGTQTSPAEVIRLLLRVVCAHPAPIHLICIIHVYLDIVRSKAWTRTSPLIFYFCSAQPQVLPYVAVAFQWTGATRGSPCTTSRVKTGCLSRWWSSFPAPLPPRLPRPLRVTGEATHSIASAPPPRHTFQPRAARWHVHLVFIVSRWPPACIVALGALQRCRM